MRHQEIQVELAREAFERLRDSKVRAKGTKLEQAEKKLNEELAKQVTLRNALNALEAKPNFEDKSAKIATEALVKNQRGRNLEIQKLGKTRAELRAIS